MESSGEFYIYRDKHDPDTFHIGTCTDSGKIYFYCSIFVDGLIDMFGRDFHDWAKKLEPGCEPQKVSVSLNF